MNKKPGDSHHPLRMFLSYSHKDTRFLEELSTHLTMLTREGLLSPWHDRRIEPGVEFKDTINRELERADLIVLLISADFLASDYCFGVEVITAVEKHERGEARLLPVILRPCDWHGAPFGRLQALPRRGGPIASWDSRDEAWLDVVREFRAVVEEISSQEGVKELHHVNKARLFALMREIFKSKDAIRSFSTLHFEDWNDTSGTGLSVAIQSLIRYCERFQLLDNLVKIIKREYPTKYTDFGDRLYEPTVQPQASLLINRGVVELRLRGDIHSQRPNIDEFLDDFRKSLVYYFGLKLEDVVITEIRTGSTIIKGLFSRSAIEKLKQADSETLASDFDIAKVEILDAILVKLDLRGAHLRGADLSAQDLRSADLRGADLEGAVLSRTILRLADLRRSNLKQASLQGADLRGANLSEASLEGANLVGARLYEANLEGTNFKGADLRLTGLQHTALAKSIYDEETKITFDEMA